MGSTLTGNPNRCKAYSIPYWRSPSYPLLTDRIDNLQVCTNFDKHFLLKRYNKIFIITVITKSQNLQTTEKLQEMKNITYRSLRGSLAFLANLKYFIRGEHIFAVSRTTQIFSLVWTIEAPAIRAFNERT